MTPLDFPLWLRVTHFFNFLFLSLLARSGLEILSAHPKLYLNDDCTPGSEWLTLSRTRRPAAGLWTATDEEVCWSPWLALPGRCSLGLGRHWHFLGDAGWIVTGIVYVVLLFAADEWRRLIPTSWAIVPAALGDLVSYLSLHLVVVPDAYNALQQLTYAAVVFLLAPLTIATGLAMSPAIAARFPIYIRLFRGRQVARSVHFLCLCAWVVFFVFHVVMVVLHGLGQELAMIVLGETEQPRRGLAIILGGIGVAAVVAINVVTTVVSRRRPRLVQRRTQAITDPLRRALFGHQISAQSYSPAEISPYLWPNGRPPAEESYWTMVRNHFAEYTLEVGGLVERPLHLTLAELRAMPKSTQITKLICIQGWSGVSEWGGVRLGHIMELCRPLPGARYAVFWAFDDKATSEPPGPAGGSGFFYGTVNLAWARHPQTILAYEMNGRALSPAHGAPLRLRVETQLGFKMVKWIRAIDFVASYKEIGAGQGGWREDHQYYSQEAGI